MNILAFDTAGESCSVALSVNGLCLEQISLEPRKQAEKILQLIDVLFLEANLKREELNGIALTHGPGAFTGVRIAISAAQGIAYGLDLPVVTVSTLAALAQGAYRKLGWQHVLAAIDARMEEVYWGCYELNDQHLMQAKLPDQVMSPALVSLPEENSLNCYGVGSGWATYSETLPKVKEHHILQVEAFDIITLASPLFAAGNTISAEAIQPIYLRDNVVKT